MQYQREINKINKQLERANKNIQRLENKVTKQDFVIERKDIQIEGLKQRNLNLRSNKKAYVHKQAKDLGNSHIAVLRVLADSVGGMISKDIRQASGYDNVISRLNELNFHLGFINKGENVKINGKQWKVYTISALGREFLSTLKEIA